MTIAVNDVVVGHVTLNRNTMRKFSYDNLEAEERLAFDRLEKQKTDAIEACKLALTSLEWCAQWLHPDGEDTKLIQKDIKDVKKALKKLGVTISD